MRNNKECKTGQPALKRLPCLMDTLCGYAMRPNFSLQSMPRFGFYGPKRKS